MSIQPTESPRTRLTQFFDFMWGETQGWVYLPQKDSANDWKKTMFEWPKHRANVVEFVLGASAAGNDVYFSPAIFSAPKPVKENFKGSHVLWADYDGSGRDDWAEMVKEAVPGSPGASLPPPTLRVQSSHPDRQHAYWRLKELSSDIEFVEGVNRAVAYLTKADISGWDVNQVLRPIETSNYKYDKPVAVIVYDENRNEYPSSQFESLRPHFKEIVNKSLDLDEIPSATAVLAKYVWETDTLDLINKSKSDLPDGKRSDALMRVGYHCAELGLEDAEIYSVLLYCDDRWEKYKGRNDRQRRLVDIINRARQKHPHATETLTFAGLVSESTPVQDSPKLVYGFRELLSLNIKIEWIVDGCIPMGGLALFASEPGVGKTQFMLNLGIACATEGQFLRWKPVKKHKILFLSLEMNLPSIKHFLGTMDPALNEEQRDLLERNFLIAPLGQPMDLMKKEGQKFIENVIESHGPSGIYIDSLQKVYPGDLSKDEIRGLFTYLSKLRAKYGVYVNLIHHDRKASDNNKKPRDLSDIYGSTYITAEPDYVVNYWRPSPDSKLIEVRTLKSRLGETPPSYTVRRVEHLQFVEVSGEEALNVDRLAKNPASWNIPDSLQSGFDLG